MGHYLVTGVAGFIASKVAEFLLNDGHTVVGIDNMNDAYDVRLKEWRLAQIRGREGFTFEKLDIRDREALGALFERSNVSTFQRRDPPGRARRHPPVRPRPPGLPGDQRDGHAEPAGAVPDARCGEVRAGLDLQPLRQGQRTALPRGHGHQPTTLALRRVQEGRRGHVLYLPLPLRHRCHRLPLLHRLRAGATALYEPFPLHAMDQRGA